MISTLIKTLTANGDTSLSFVDGTSDVVFNNTYDEYMFVLTDIGPAGNGAALQFQVNASNESGYNEILTSTAFGTQHGEGGAGGQVGYNTGADQPQGTSFQTLFLDGTGNVGDESGAGILHIYSPSNATYVTHFQFRGNNYRSDDYTTDDLVAGYFNTAANTGSVGPIVVDEIQFKMSSGAFDGVIQMFGIA